MSDDRKYRQRGYQDDNRDRKPSGPRPDSGGGKPEREPGAPAGARRISSEGARNPRMMTSRQVARCARCGTIVDAEIMSLSKCPKCQVESPFMHSVRQFRSGRDLRMRGENSRARLTQGRRQRLPALQWPYHLRARNHSGGQPEQQPKGTGRRQKGFRRSLQVLMAC